MGLNVEAFHWRRSSRCEGGNCAEAAADADFVYLRDTKDPRQRVLRFDHDVWRAFVAGLKTGNQAVTGR